VQVAADSLDKNVQHDLFLSSLADALGAYDIDVTSNLNSREVVRQRIQNTRLGRFPDISFDNLASSEEIASWETAYRGADLGGVAILVNGSAEVSSESFIDRWLQSPDEARLFVTFYADDLAAAEKLAYVATNCGHAVDLAFGVGSVNAAAEKVTPCLSMMGTEVMALRRAVNLRCF
jgi:hypothetical protein